jgi:endogenous inhibitor of DNA gyrase (YacG/DUF329 family)
MTTACPHCGKTASLDASNRWRPFCSERCKLIDLGEWIEGRYSIPAEEQPQPAHRPQDDQ